MKASHGHNSSTMDYGLMYKLQIPDTLNFPYLLTTYIYKNRFFFFSFLGRKFFLANAERSRDDDAGGDGESV